MRSRRGFTIVELLLVVVIIGILAGAIAVSLSGRSEEARIARARSDINGSLGLALDVYEQDNGRYPTTDQGLEALVGDPGDVPNWRGPYIKELKVDPWDTPYVYQNDGTGIGRYTLYSAGPDQTPGTEDDVQ